MDKYDGGESWTDAFKRYGANFGWWFVCFWLAFLILSAFLGPNLYALIIAGIVGLIASPRLPWRK